MNKKNLHLDLEDVLPVRDLSFEKWKNKVLSRIDKELVNACLLFIEKMRTGQQLSKEEMVHAKSAIDSFCEVSFNAYLKFN